MKKLIISTVAVALAVAANAAPVSWGITGVKQGDVSLTKGHTYMFFAEDAATAASQIAAIIAKAGSGASEFQTAMGSAAWNDTKKATAAGTFSIGTSSAMGKYTLPTNADLGLEGNKTYFAYGVIFDTETITDASKYIIAQGTPTTTGFTTNGDTSSTTKNFNLGSQSSATWYAVGAPEPTSGLMLLLGVGVLALRRRRA